MGQIWTQLSRFTRQFNHAPPNLPGTHGFKPWGVLAQIVLPPLSDWFFPGPLSFASAAQQISKFNQLYKFYRALSVLVFLGMLVATPVTQAKTLLQAGGSVLQVTGPAQVSVGDTFEIRVLLDQPPPGVFGFQFRLNWDGPVNVLDLILLAVNFGQSAAAHPWICQP